MKKYSLSILLFILTSAIAVNAQCYSLNYRDFDLEDFLVDTDEDTIKCGAYMLAYYRSEDTTSTVRIISNGGKQIAQGRQQVTVSITRKQESMREIQSQRVAFFTSEMSLTPEEAQTFWPLYNQYTEKKNKLVEEQKMMMRGFTEEKVVAMSKSEAEAMVNAFVKLQQQENDLTQEYHKKFMSQLPASKVLLMYKAEKDFMQNLLKYLKGGERKGKE